MKQQLNTHLQRLMDAFHLPGMAVVIVDHNDVTFCAELGYANIETGLPFTADTCCLVASVTKSFTAGLAACLVDQGLLEWTKPIRHYIPGFRMMDEFATREVTLEDMLCHRTGLPYHENLLAHGVGRELNDTGRAYRAELLKRLAHFDPSTSFRSHFQYQDIVYSCAGAVLEQVADEDYETLVRRDLLAPLGMTQSTFVRAEARASGRLAQHYAWVAGRHQPIDFCDTRYIAPSAGLYSTANEMVAWLKLQLGQGRYGESVIITPENMAWLHRPHMATPGSAALGGGVTAYGQGWFLGNVRGQLAIVHGGSFNGHRTFVGFLPEQQVGVVVLANLNLTEGVPCAGLIVLDHLLGVDAVDERIAFGQRRAQFFRHLEEEDARLFAAGRDPAQQPTHELHHYAGVYDHPGYGRFTVALAGGTLVQSYDGRTYPLQPYNGDTFAGNFQSTENHLLTMTFTFESNDEGRINALSVPLIPDIPTPRFHKE